VPTLVISDLHLGMRRGRDVLSHEQPLDLLLQALEGVDRLVLLGDVLELMGRRRARAMAAAEPVLRALGKRLGADREVVIVPGNHDRGLVRPWLRQIGPRLAPDSRVPLDASPELATLTSLLAPANVSARYPGIWLSPGVWATHGHYLNRHLLPSSSIGVHRGLLGRPPRDGARPVDYERPAGGKLAGPPRTVGRWVADTPRVVTDLLPGPIGAVADKLGTLARAATMPRMARSLLRPELAPLNASLLTTQMTRASLPALAHVVQRLGIAADWVVFGHVHRLGPLAGDDPAQWEGPDGHPRLVNTGSWLYEPLLVNRATPPHPYWPGGAVRIEDGRDPEPVGLLDHLPARALR
jgi:UDP-2,3-diacylglucosamine pyrophosphatase LpxH